MNELQVEQMNAVEMEVEVPEEIEMSDDSTNRIIHAVSPTVRLARTDYGLKITVTDVNGTREYEIYDGQKGETGDTGQTPNIQIGIVETGAERSEAEASMTGTPEAPILNMTIPRGDTGAKGDTGEKGDTGTTFTPYVSSSGVISWTNDDGKENPEPINIKGDTGDKGDKGDKGDTGDRGKDFHIAMVFASVAAMQAYTGPVEMYDYVMIDTGDVEDPETGRLYCYEQDSTWHYIGDLSGAQGIKGDTGTGIDRITLNSDYTLTIFYDNGTSLTTNSIRGATGNGIASVSLNSDYTLTIVYTDGNSHTTSSIRGMTGLTPSISIGTVTTLQPGSQAYVNLDPSSTPENPVLNIGIPKGPPGDVEDVTYDRTTGKIRKTRNGTAEDVVSVADIKAALGSFTWGQLAGL